MGISGLLPLLRSITRRVHLEQFAGQYVAVDAYSWLHKGVYGACAIDHFHGRRNNSFVEFCLGKLRLLLNFNVKPIMVFDGAPLPMKKHQENYRGRSRKESREKALELISQGNVNAAHVHIQKSIDVTPEMAAELIVELQKLGIDYVVAPYEADAQMSWLDRTGKVAAVLTEDSDLLPFGCRRVLFKLDKEGWAEEICLSRLNEATELDFGNFSLSKFRHMCLLSGCDYLPSIHGMGLKTAYKYIVRYPTIQRVLQVLRAEMPLKMPSDYESEFAKAELTFLHQRVYDTDNHRIVHLNPLPLSMDQSTFNIDDLDFLGATIPDSIAREICLGRMCPNTRQHFSKLIPPPLVNKINTNVEVDKIISSLPFTLVTERQSVKVVTESNKVSSTAAYTSSVITAARVSLKRPYSTTTVTTSSRSVKSHSSVKLPAQYSFIRSIPNYFPSKGATTTSKNIPIDPKQRSIRDFFRTKPSSVTK